MEVTFARNLPNVTESSARFTAHILDAQQQKTDGWIETHIHFGRYGVIDMVVVVAAPDESFERLTAIVELEFQQIGLWLMFQAGVITKLVDNEIRPTVFLNGEHRPLMFVTNGNELPQLLRTDWKEKTTP